MVKGEYGGICTEAEGNADYGGTVQPSQQHVTPYVKGGKCGDWAGDVREQCRET